LQTVFLDRDDKTENGAAGALNLTAEKASMKASRQMALTPDFVARMHREIEDPSPDPHLFYISGF
jgi:hypothetical protein